MRFKNYYLLENIVKAFDQLSLSPSDLDSIVHEFYKVNTVAMPDGSRRVLPLDKAMAKAHGTTAIGDMDSKELYAYVFDMVKQDIIVSREDIKRTGQNPIDFMLDRALDPLDPMRGMYRIFLGKLGADVSGKGIKLTPELNQAMNLSNKEL